MAGAGPSHWKQKGSGVFTSVAVFVDGLCGWAERGNEAPIRASGTVTAEEIITKVRHGRGPHSPKPNPRRATRRLHARLVMSRTCSRARVVRFVH
jgi:hypothetical protein